MTTLDMFWPIRQCPTSIWAVAILIPWSPWRTTRYQFKPRQIQAWWSLQGGAKSKKNMRQMVVPNVPKVTSWANWHKRRLAPEQSLNRTWHFLSLAASLCLSDLVQLVLQAFYASEISSTLLPIAMFCQGFPICQGQFSPCPMPSRVKEATLKELPKLPWFWTEKTAPQRADWSHGIFFGDWNSIEMACQYNILYIIIYYDMPSQII